MARMSEYIPPVPTAIATLHNRCKSFGMVNSRDHTDWYVRCEEKAGHSGTDHIRSWGGLAVHWLTGEPYPIRMEGLSDEFLSMGYDNADCIRAVDRMVCKFGDEGDCKCPDSSKVGVNKIGERI